MGHSQPKFETKVVKAIRGTENRVLQKWEGEGWELVSQNSGRLQTTFNFRKQKPPTNWKLIGGLAAALILCLAGLGIAGIFSGDKEDAAIPAQIVESETSSPLPSEVATSEATVAESSPASTPTQEEVITAENTPLFATVLGEKSPSYASVQQFASEYQGRKIEFDGAVVDVLQTEKFSAHFYDFLVSPGDYNPDTAIGPNFKFDSLDQEDVKSLGISPERGTNVHVIAEVVKYDSTSELFFLRPVEISKR